LLAAGGLTLADGPHGVVIPHWFPLGLNLQVLSGIQQELGGEALFQIGVSVPRYANFPPAINDLSGAMQALDVAFHMNHRRDGVVMYDAAKEEMLEGIGHYGRACGADGHLVGRSSSVYPCAFDRGIFAGLAARFEPGSQVDHGPQADCRDRGGPACIYVIRRRAAPR
jgi:hypothetical protein